VIWFLIRGESPTKMIDHIDGNKLNNRIENLRLVSQRENCMNQKIHRNGRLVGATFHKNSGKWRSDIKINNKQLWLGIFKTPQLAHEAYMEKLKEIKRN
jgi:hypothetical protein